MLLMCLMHACMHGSVVKTGRSDWVVVVARLGPTLLPPPPPSPLHRLRHHKTGQIVEQLLVARKHLRDVGDATPILRIVFMGMGEPFDNFESVHKVLRSFSKGRGGGWGALIYIRLIVSYKYTYDAHRQTSTQK